MGSVCTLLDSRIEGLRTLLFDLRFPEFNQCLPVLPLGSYVAVFSFRESA